MNLMANNPLSGRNQPLAPIQTKEFERQFEVTTLPPILASITPIHLHAGYLAKDGDVKVELRQVERMGTTKYYETVRLRAENGQETPVEVELTADQFKKLWPASQASTEQNSGTDNVTIGLLAYTKSGAVRIRSEEKNGSTKWYQTAKIGRGEERVEQETELTREQFEKLWPTTRNHTTEKLRFPIPDTERVIIIDRYLAIGGKPIQQEFLKGEVESRTLAESRAFTPPDYFGKEVTGDSRFNDSSIAYNGLPSNA